MSDIRMQSIFLDEEFIYKDASDIKRLNLFNSISSA